MNGFSTTPNQSGDDLFAAAAAHTLAEREAGIFRNQRGEAFRRIPAPAHVSETDGGGIGYCPCAECIHYDWQALDGVDGRPTLSEYRIEQRLSMGLVRGVDFA